MATPTALSPQLRKTVEEIIDKPEYGLVEVECRLKSPTNKEVDVEVKLFESMDIVQNFAFEAPNNPSQYQDMINIEFKLQPEDYITVMKNSKNLKCYITLHQVDEKTHKRIKPVMTLESKIIFRNKNDLLKKYPFDEIIVTNPGTDYEHKHSMFIPISAQLMDEKMYDLRKIKVNAIFRDTTVYDVLVFLTDLFSVKKLWLVPPDNTKKYTNLYIPPMLDISNIFKFLQIHDGYGVYEKGFSFYYTRDTLYIYPDYDTSPHSPLTVNLYKIPDNMFTGTMGYHIYKNGNPHIVINTPVQDHELSDELLENIGSAYLIQKGEKLIDQIRTPMEGDMYTVHEDNTHIVFLDTNKGIVDKVYQPDFNFSYDNEYVYKSMLAANEVVEMSFQWKHAVPFTFKPGWKVNYHYDGDDGVYQMRTGVCTSAAYSLRKAEKLTKQLYALIANINLRLTNKSTIM